MWVGGLPLVSLVALGGCSQHRPTTPADAYPAEEWPILREKSGVYSRITRAVRVVARDRATLAQIPITELDVDFATEMVLIAGLGPTPGNEMGIRITRVWRAGSALRVQERQIHPGFDRAPGLSPASPWAVAVIPRSDLNVEGYTARVEPGVMGEHPGER